jgi:hypothetical protein
MMTLNLLEGYLKNREISKLNALLIQNPEALYEGRYSVDEEINRNIQQYLSRSFKYKLGVRTNILVNTKDDRILYPTQHQFGRESPDETYFSKPHPESLNYPEVASENYRILNEGLILSVDVRIKHNSWLSNTILVLYIFIALFIIRKFIWKGIEETEAKDKEQQRHIQQLSNDLVRAQSRLLEEKTRETDLLERISALKRDKKDLSKDVDGLLEEMERLEAGLKDQRRIKEETEVEVLRLMEELDQQKEKFEKPKKKKKKTDVTTRRFNVLYRNLAFTERAVEGFMALNDEFQLKAEEVIHKLNEDDSQVPVKRKVFGKGGKMNVREVRFAYSGRIYFQQNSQSRTRILTIGTKNTQQRDLAYIESTK